MNKKRFTKFVSSALLASMLVSLPYNVKAEKIKTFSSEEEVNKEDKINFFKEELKKIKEIKNNKEKITKLNDLKISIENSDLLFIDKKPLVKEVENYKSKIENVIYGDMNVFSKSEFERKTSLISKGDGIYLLKLPNAGEDYYYKVNILNSNNNRTIVKKDIFNKEDLELSIPNIGYDNHKIEALISVMNIKDNKEFLSYEVSKDFKENISPKIEYLYIKDNKLHYSIIEENKLVDSYLVIEQSNKETKKIKIDDKKGVVDIVEYYKPLKIEFVLKDNFNNLASYYYVVEKNNYTIDGKAPQKIQDEFDYIKQKEKDRERDREKDRNNNRDKKKHSSSYYKTFRDFDNVIKADYKEYIDIKRAFEDTLDDYFGSRYYDDIEIKGDLKVDRDDFIYTDKRGLLEFTAKHKKKELKLYIFIEDYRDDYYKIDKVEISEKEFYKDEKIYLHDVLDFKFKKDEELGRSDLEHIFIIVEDDDYAFSYKEDYRIDDNKERVYILDSVNNKTYKLDVEANFKKEDDYKVIYETQGNFKRYFTDVYKDYWAEKPIRSLVEKGVIKGYPDRTFRPNNTMTVREFYSLYGKFLKSESHLNVNKVNNNANAGLSIRDWGYYEAQNVINRIDKSKLKNFNTNNLNRNITREEVAFLINNTISFSNTAKASNPYEKTKIKDINGSKYEEDIIRLINQSLLNGYPNQTFQPKRNIKRAEVANLLYKLSN